MALLAFTIPPTILPVSLGSSERPIAGSERLGALSANGSVPVAPPVKLLREGDNAPLIEGSDRTPFALNVGELLIPYSVMAITALPGESLELSVELPPNGGGPEEFRLLAEDGVVPEVGPGRWQWSAPLTPGAVPLRVEALSGSGAIHLNVLILHPFDQIDDDGALNGYRIGRYRIGPGGDLPPPGFVEGVPDVLDLRVAPHFTLRQFLCKQLGEPPYMAISERLVLKLEAILEGLAEEGIEVETLEVMSGFRTPAYNRAIGNVTDGSRHLWGDAADIFVDRTGDGWMDDLNGDGEIDLADGDFLYGIAERVDRSGDPHIEPGGLSLYPENSVHGPFVHVDARGFRARW